MTAESLKRVTLEVRPRTRAVELAQPPRSISLDVALGARIRSARVELQALPVRIVGEADWYEGDYEVDPRFVQQQLETKSHAMREDVTVHAIRVASVDNLSGGKTVWIGKE